MNIAYGLIDFIAGFLLACFLCYRANLWTWNRVISSLQCSGCQRWMGKDGKPGPAIFNPAEHKQAEQRDLIAFARRGGWKVETRPTFIARCPECEARHKTFHQENAA